MRQVHFCSFLFQTYNHSITVTQAFPVKNYCCPLKLFEPKN